MPGPSCTTVKRIRGSSLSVRRLLQLLEVDCGPLLHRKTSSDLDLCGSRLPDPPLYEQPSAPGMRCQCLRRGLRPGSPGAP